MQTRDDIETVLDTIREQVDPSRDEQADLDAAVEQLAMRARRAADERDVDLAGVTQTGSTARGTFVSGDRDIDLFIEFPPETDEQTLEQDGLAIGDAILPDSQRDFAAHPYTKGTFRDFDVDVVPCFAVDDASEIQSAVDRTPFHTRFLEQRLTDDLAADVRVAKAFLKGIGAYGSDVATGGFSGFLTELLVLEHDGFVPLLKAAAKAWQFPVGVFNPGNHSTDTLSAANQLDVMVVDDLHIRFEDPLVVIDPTDPGRNVAAALSEEKLGTFILNARQFLDNPDEAFFEQDGPSLSPENAASVLECRGTTPVALLIDRPDDVVDDTFVPQLQKSLNGVTAALDRRGFDVFRADVFADDERGALFMELAVAERPVVERHEGPPVDLPNADEFLAAYEDDTSVTGPFVDGNSLVVEREREFRSAMAFLTSDTLLEEVAFGPVVEQAVRNDEMVVQETLGGVLTQFPDQLAQYADATVLGTE